MKTISDNPSVASVTQDGLITANAPGKYNIAVYADNDTLMGYHSGEVISPNDKIPVTGITLNKSSLSLKYSYSSSARLKATVTPANASNKAVRWVSSDPNALSVKDGYVKCLENGEGQFTVTASTVDGSYTATCAVTITRTGTVVNWVKPTTIELDTYDATSAEVQIGTTDYDNYNTGYTVFANDAAVTATSRTSSGFDLVIPKNTGGTRTIEVYVHGNFSGWEVDDPDTYHTIKVIQPYYPFPSGWGSHSERQIVEDGTIVGYAPVATYFLAVGGTAYRHVYDPETGKSISGDAQIQIRCAKEAWNSIFKGTTVSAPWIHISQQEQAGWYLVEVDKNETGVARDGTVNIPSGLTYDIYQDA